MFIGKSVSILRRGKKKKVGQSNQWNSDDRLLSEYRDLLEVVFSFSFLISFFFTAFWVGTVQGEIFHTFWIKLKYSYLWLFFVFKRSGNPVILKNFAFFKIPSRQGLVKLHGWNFAFPLSVLGGSSEKKCVFHQKQLCSPTVMIFPYQKYVRAPTCWKNLSWFLRFFYL